MLAPKVRCLVWDWIPHATASASNTGPPICPMRLGVEVSMNGLGSPSPLPGARVLTTLVNIPSRGSIGSGTDPRGQGERLRLLVVDRLDVVQGEA